MNGLHEDTIASSLSFSCRQVDSHVMCRYVAFLLWKKDQLHPLSDTLMGKKACNDKLVKKQHSLILLEVSSTYV
eukprot:c36585_g1_i1 orf=3-221(-)